MIHSVAVLRASSGDVADRYVERYARLQASAERRKGELIRAE
jgi:hypothetical protein